MKPGIKTTEFYGKSLVQLVLILNMIFGLGLEIDHQTSLLIVGGLEALYGLVRGVVKSKSSQPVTVTNTQSS